MAVAYEEVLRTIRARAAVLDRLDDALAAQVVQILEDVQRELLLEISEFNAATQRPSFRRARLKALKSQVQSTLQRAYGQITTRTHTSLTRIAETELETAHRAIAQALKPLEGLASANTVIASPDLLATLGKDNPIRISESRRAAPVSKWFEAQNKKTQKKLLSEFRKGFLRGESNQEITRRIAGGGRHSGVLKVSKNWAEAVTRTATTATSRRARDRVYKANPETVRGVFQVSTRDERVTLICLAYHMLTFVYEGGDLVPDGHGLPYDGGVPRHIRCRSSEAPWVKSWQEMGFEESDLSPQARRIMNGETPKERGEDLLKRRRPEFAEKTLGPTRARLWREGKVGLKDMLDSKGNVRKVAELLAD